MTQADALRAAGTSAAAIQGHYDLSDEFFALWLGDDLTYSCALWDDTDTEDTLERAQQRKLDHFATRLRVAGADVLDVGCGWGGLLDRFTSVHGAASGVGLTLSPAQQQFAKGRTVPRSEFRVESWVDHDADRGRTTSSPRSSRPSTSRPTPSTPTPRWRSTGPSSTGPPPGCGTAAGWASS